MFSLIYLSSLLTLSTGWQSKDIYFSWTSRGEGYEYIVEVYTDREFTQIYTQTEPLDTNFVYITFTESNLYFVRIKSFVPNSNDYEYSNWGQIYLNLEHEYLGEDVIWFEPEEEVATVEPTPVSVVEEIYQYTLPKDLDMREGIVVSNESVLGSSTENCSIYIFKYEDDTDISFNCKTGLRISSIKYIGWEEYLTLQVDGTYFGNIYANVKVFECKKFNIFNPSTWIGCQKVLVDSYTGDIRLRYGGYLTFKGTPQQNIISSFANTSFFVENIYTKSYYGNDIYGSDVKLILEVSFSAKGKEWIDGVYSLQKTIKIPKLEKAPQDKPFDFPFEKYIGVTQWHGCTLYQCPHKAIDFGAYLNRVISVGDGTVVSAGYDKYGGECNQGGRYVIVKHTNGMYSSYFHLDSYCVKVGDRIKSGSLIGISGNSGRWNCQNLGYHLHFDIRKSRDSSTHVNPVEYINVDWNLIPTLGYKQYPKRLSGENPHPNF